MGKISETQKRENCFLFGLNAILCFCTLCVSLALISNRSCLLSTFSFRCSTISRCICIKYYIISLGTDNFVRTYLFIRTFGWRFATPNYQSFYICISDEINKEQHTVKKMEPTKSYSFRVSFSRSVLCECCVSGGAATHLLCKRTNSDWVSVENSGLWNVVRW